LDSANYQTVIETMKLKIKEVMDKGEIPGLAIALVDKDKIIWSEGFGYTDTTKKEKVTADTLFSTQSMAKTVTATTFMILASKGLIALDEPLRKYYPDFTVNTKFGDKDEEIAKITFRKLMGHSAGFTHEAPRGNNFDDSNCTFDEHIISINNTWLRSKVGSEFAYSNIGLDLTAFVLGKIKNKSFLEVVKEELFQPLGIEKATLDINEALKHSFAKGHIGGFETPTIQVPMLGAAGVYISVNEQAKFAMLHLNNGNFEDKQLITRENFDEMYKSQFEKEGIKLPFGLGLFKDRPIDNVEPYTHGGGGYGYLTNHVWVPKYNLAAIVFTNSMGHNNEQVNLSRQALELMIKEKSKPQTVEIAPEKLQRLVGTYYTQRALMQNVVHEDGKLVVYNKQGKRTSLYPQNELEFLTEDDKKFVFKLDKQNRAETLEHHLKNYFVNYKYNDRPNEQPGLNNKSWQEFLGIYEIHSDAVKYYIALGVCNGHLYLYFYDKYKLQQYQENHFFTADGELLILEKDKVSFRYIPMTKTDFKINELVEDCKENEHKRFVYKDIFSNVKEILYWKKDFDTTYEFICKIIEIDNIYKEILSEFGTMLYAYRKLEQAKKCFSQLLSQDEEDTKAQEMLERIEKEQKSTN